MEVQQVIQMEAPEVLLQDEDAQMITDLAEQEGFSSPILFIRRLIAERTANSHTIDSVDELKTLLRASLRKTVATQPADEVFDELLEQQQQLFGRA